jgi:hypothetical protein
MRQPSQPRCQRPVRSSIMFGRQAKTPAPEPSTGPQTDPETGKGRATPSRREAEAARKTQIKIPKDPKAAKQATRSRDRQAREAKRKGMASGDPRYLPARDQGAGRAFARDFVDARFTLAEVFIFVAVGVLLLGFIRQPVIQQWVSILFFAFTALIAVDMVVLLIQLNKRARAMFPDAADRKGLSLYAALRTLQLRRLRLPGPRVKRGGAPKN